MTEPLNNDQMFIRKLTEIVLRNLNNENFGVDELVHESGMSRYRLNRRLNSITKKTIIKFIREIRLEKAEEMLHDDMYTVAEVAYKTGFGSSNYFNKCFSEFYGYPPGKVRKGELNNQDFSYHAKSDIGTKPEKNIISQYVPNLPGKMFFIILLGIVGSGLFKDIHISEGRNVLINSSNGISLAVMPFRNMTNDTTWNIWQGGIQNSLVTFLTESEGLTIKSSVNELLQSKGITDYALLKLPVENIIARKLNADLFISGGIINAGEKIRITAQIYDTEKENVLKSFEIEGPDKEELIYQSIDSLRRLVNNFLIIAKLKKDNPNSANNFFDPVRSPEAYRYMVSGDNAFDKMNYTGAIEMYKKAIGIDSNIYDAYHNIAFSYEAMNDLANCKKWLLRYYTKYDKLDMYNKLFANYAYAFVFQTPHEATGYLEQLIAISDKPYNYVNLGDEYYRTFQYDKAIPEYEKALDYYERLGIKPYTVRIYTYLGKAYYNKGQHRKERKLYKKAEQYYSNEPHLIYRQAVLALTQRNKKEAEQLIEKFISSLREHSISEAGIATRICDLYSESKILDKAEAYCRQSILLEPDNPDWLNVLAYFLIDNDRHFVEGTELVEKVLKIDPENYNYLHTKGWALYKEGRYQEALETLQKSWNIRREQAVYDHMAFLHLEAAKRAVSAQL